MVRTDHIALKARAAREVCKYCSRPGGPPGGPPACITSKLYTEGDVNRQKVDNFKYKESQFQVSIFTQAHHLFDLYRIYVLC